MLSCLFPTHALQTESTLVRIYWFLHHTNKSIRRLPIIINLLKFVVLPSLRCLVPVRVSIIVVTSTQTSHYNNDTTSKSRSGTVLL